MRTHKEVAAELTGLLENAAPPFADPRVFGITVACIIRDRDLLFLNCGAKVCAKAIDDGTIGLGLLSSVDSDAGLAVIPNRDENRPRGSNAPVFLSQARRTSPFLSSSGDFNLVIDWRMDGDSSIQAGGCRARRHYAARFNSAVDVARHVARNFERLYAPTRSYGTRALVRLLATALVLRADIHQCVNARHIDNRFRFADGRFYGSEGAGGPGTCTHVALRRPWGGCS